MISCYCVKYNLWYYDYKDKTNDKATRLKLLPVVQKIIIHTVIDIINSCIENAEEDNKNKIFEILKTKFYKKINDTFSNKELYARLKEQNMPSTIGDKKSFILTKAEAFLLNGKYLTEFEPVLNWRKIKPAKMFLEIKSRDIEKFDDINNITNCESGTFHEWVADGKTFKCKKCNLTTREIKFEKQETNKIKNKFHIVELKSLSKKYCYIDGIFHEYQNNEAGVKICRKCKTPENKDFTDAELDKLDKILIENKKNTISKNLSFNNEILEENKKYDEYISKLKDKIKTEYTQYIKDNEIKYIDELVELFEQNMNEDLLKSNISIKHNLYVFDHDYYGNKLDKEISISEKENKIQYKSSHSFYNTDVIYYTTYKAGKVDVFYDAITKVLIGYKEENKNFISNIRSDRKIRIIYSIRNKLKMLGHKYQFYNFKEININKLTNSENINTTTTSTSASTNSEKNIIEIEYISNIIRDRHTLLKNTPEGVRELNNGYMVII
jgi:hypothetical protein